MRNKISTKDLIAERFSKEKTEKILAKADEEIEEIKWGGKRAGAGRKPKGKGEVLEFNRRLTAKENQFIYYARAHNINYDDLMQG